MTHDRRSSSGVDRAAAPTNAADAPSPVLFEVDVSTDSESHFFVGLSGDIAHPGFFVATWRDVPVGERVILAARIRDGAGRELRLVIAGFVRWVRDARCETGPGLGVELSWLSEHDADRIARFCDERPPYFYEVEAA
jgi:hypothetical protein